MTKLQAELIKKQKCQIQELKDIIALKCYECQAWQADKSLECAGGDCPLYPYRLNRLISGCSKRLASKARVLRAKFKQKNEVANNED